MLRCVNAPACLLLLLVAVVLPGCRSTERSASPSRAPAATDVAATPAPPADAGAAAPASAMADAREESARFFPEPYDNLWIGEPLPEFQADYPDARPYDSRGDPERLEWRELEGANGLLVRLGFAPGPTGETTPLRSVQFMSLLPAPASPEAPPTAGAIAAWQSWITEAYAPHLAALKEKYGEQADVFACGGGMKHPIVRIVWRGRTLAVTEAFMMHDKGLSSTLMITPLATADRYVRATQCRWIQDRVM